MKMLPNKLRQFRQDEAGTAAIELLFAVPLLLWTLMSTFVYFDAYRAQSISVRASLTVADMFSREETPISPDYMDGVRNVLALLSESDAQPDFRVTVFTYRSPPDNDFRLVWSQNRGLGPNLNNADLERMRDSFPRMSDNDRAILLETVTDYSAPFSTPLMFYWREGQSGGSEHADGNVQNITFDNMVVIKPRYTNNFCFDPTPANPTNGDDDC